MVKIIRFIVDAVVAAVCVYILIMAADALTYPLMDMGNALAPLFGR